MTGRYVSGDPMTLLTPEEALQLCADLAELARLRADAEAWAATQIIGGGQA